MTNGREQRLLLPTPFRKVKKTLPTRRERLRTATVTELKELARQLLVAGGPAAISLRAIARAMGMTAPAIYRYFPSLDALVADLTADLYAELTEAIEAARSPGPTRPSQANANANPHSDQVILDQLLDMARAFRTWSLANPAEFGLMFGSPVPGVVLFEEDCISPDHPGARFGAPFLEAFATLYARRDVTERGLTEDLFTAFTAASGVILPAPVVHAYLAAWARLYGLVALEVFGHMRWALDDTSTLFEMELAAFVDELR
jgi:AcrR family transcriptional regulator